MSLIVCLSTCLALVQTPAAPSPATPTPAPAPSPSPWRSFASPKGGFTVSLPGEATDEEKEVTSPNGKSVVVRTTTCQADGVRYTIVRVPLPVVIGYDERTPFFRGNIDSMVRRDQGRITTEKAITDVGQPCREVTYEVPREDGKVIMLVRARMYLFGANYYTQTMIGPKDTFPAPAAAKFFQSFRFGGGRDTTKVEPKPGGPVVKSKRSGQ